MVGGATTNVLVLTGVADEIALVDAQPERAVAEAGDVPHATPLAPNAPGKLKPRKAPASVMSRVLGTGNDGSTAPTDLQAAAQRLSSRLGRG
jgi:hypothetical protein